MAKDELRLVDGPASTYKIEAIVGIDERGQMVLPKELRERLGIAAGDKIAVVGFEDRGEMCCICLFKVEDLSGMVREKLEPVLRGALR